MQKQKAVTAGRILSEARFSYVQYDEKAASQQATFKEKFVELAALVEDELAGGRAKSLILTALEEAYMWTGKAIRDEQIFRSPGTGSEFRQRSNS